LPTLTNQLLYELKAMGNPSDALFYQRFFKTGPGEYGEGDCFLGIRVPQIRAVANKYVNEISVSELGDLLKSKWHEVRFAALVIMRSRFNKVDKLDQKQIYELYLANIGGGINNWDLVDVSCPRIVGAYLYDKNHQPLYKLAHRGLWQKRVSIISTFYFLKYGEPGDTYNLAELLVDEEHDLLQKAVGWALREMGKLDSQLLYQFLDKYATTMPRTALRYSLEKQSLSKKQYYMNLKVENQNRGS
jgi:3-methyladenine DNA glycosylase AlkD